MRAPDELNWLENLFAPPRVMLLTGPRRVGKTVFCLRVWETARASGWTVAGVLSPGRYDDAGQRTGIDLLDPASGDRWPLAVPEPDPQTGLGWQFSPEVMAKGAALLAASGAPDLLLVDELGPLELEQGAGWVRALDVLRAGRYQRALVVVRPSLLAALSAELATLPLSVLSLPVEDGSP